MDDATWLHHPKAHNYSRWMEEAIKDADLSADVRRAEDGRGDAASTRKASEGSRGGYTAPGGAIETASPG